MGCSGARASRTEESVARPVMVFFWTGRPSLSKKSSATFLVLNMPSLLIQEQVLFMPAKWLQELEKVMKLSVLH